MNSLYSNSFSIHCIYSSLAFVSLQANPSSKFTTVMGRLHRRIPLPTKLAILVNVARPSHRNFLMDLTHQQHVKPARVWSMLQNHFEWQLSDCHGRGSDWHRNLWSPLSAAWSNLCPKCGNDNMCAATGPFNGSFCNAQPITYEKVNCPGGGEEMAQIQES